MEPLVAAAPDPAAAWFADRLAFEALAEAPGTDQAAMVQRSAPAGHMTPLHRRDVAEIYRVLDGEVTFHIGAEVVVAGPGDVVVAPPRAPRTLRTGAQQARWLVLTRVRSLERFVDFGRAVAPPLAQPCDGWPEPAERAAVAATAAANGIELLGPPGALPSGQELSVC